MEEKQVQLIVKQSLQKIHEDWQETQSSFTIYLQNLKISQDLSAFISDIFEHRQELDLKPSNIREFLEQLGKHDQAIKTFGKQFFLLWLQFQFLKHAKLKAKRLEQHALDDFPRQKDKQSKFINGLCQSYIASSIEGLQEKVINGIKQHHLYKKFMTFLDDNPPNVRKSKIVVASQVRSSMSSITKVDRISCGLTLLKQIVDEQIGVVSRITDFVAKQKELQDYFSDVMERPCVEADILSKQLKQIIFQTLHIKIKSNISFLQSKKPEVLENSFKTFKLFYECQIKVSEVLRRKTSFKQFFKYFQQLVKTVEEAWYWPTLEKESLFITLRNECLSEKQLGRQFFRLFKSKPPILAGFIFTQEKRGFMEEATHEVPNTPLRSAYADCLIQIAKAQSFDLEQKTNSNETYLDILQQFNPQREKLTRSFLKESDYSQESHFIIFDLATRENRHIYLSKENKNELLQKIKNPHIYREGQFDTHFYYFQFSITDLMMEGRYIPTGLSNKGDSVKCQGPLLYSDLREFLPEIKKFSYSILSNKEKEIPLTGIDSQKMGDQIYKIYKGKEKNTRFRVKINPIEEMLEVDAQTLSVKKMTALSKVNSSLIKEDVGVLIFAPAYKGKKIEEEREIIEDEDDDLIQMENNDFEPKNKRYGFVSDLQDEDSQEEDKVISNQTTFKCLAAFQECFTLNEGYRIQEKKHVVATTTTAKEYFKKFQEKQIYNLLDKNTLAKCPAKMNDQISRFFSLRKDALPVAETKLKELPRRCKKEVYYNYNPKVQNITVENMCQQMESNHFFMMFFDYCNYEAIQKKSKQSTILRVNQEQKAYLKRSVIPNVKITAEQNSEIQIECSKKEKKKLIKELETLDEIGSFIYKDPQILAILKNTIPELLQQIGLKEEEITEETFTVSYKLRYHRKFHQEYLLCCQREAQKPTQLIQKLIEKGGQFIHIYRSQLDKEDPEISITKMGDDVLLQFDKKLKKNVDNALTRVNALKQQEIFEIGRNSSKAYEIKGLSFQLISLLANKLQHLLNQSSGKGMFKAQIKIEGSKDNKGCCLLSGFQISKDQEKLLEKWMANFEKNYQTYKKYRFQIFDTQKYFNKVFLKLPANKQYKKKMADLNHKFKVFLKVELQKQIQKAVQKGSASLLDEFTKFLQNSKLDSGLFASSIVQKVKSTIEQKIETLGIFQKFVRFRISELDENNEKATASKNLINQTKQLVGQLEAMFKKGKLNPRQMMRFYKSVAILSEVYFGTQLPITPHLQDFREILEKNDVVMVKVGTGTGKSTVIPPYLVGLGYQKVIVTQPRRLPCRQIYKRISSVFGRGVAGYWVGDGKEDIKNSLLYMTDGLLKMRAIYHEEVFDDIDVLVIDEIHERSVNIDVLLLLIYDYYLVQRRRMKLVLCSATIDPKIGGIMKDANLSVGVFEPAIPSKYTVKEIQIKEMTILERILELSKKMQSDEQMLVFFPGVNQVQKNVKLLQDKYHKLAYPITANQNPREQEVILAKGQIFISTAIAQTSLTFRKLKYVIDSRMSRWRTFDPDLELMKTEESFSSNSSIKQRKGRVGRTCNGQYHFYVYQDYDFANNREHNPTELEKSDFTNTIFELMLRKESHFKLATGLLKKLKHDSTEFERKIKHTKEVMIASAILDKNDTLFRHAKKLTSFGNLGNPQHNMALFGGLENGCLVNICYLVAFQMFGAPAAGLFIQHCKGLYKGGDIKVVHDFLIQTGKKINLTRLKEKHIAHEINQQCSALKGKPFFNLLKKIMIKTKQLLQASKSNIPAPDSRWTNIMDIFMSAYSNRIFFNQSLFGGKKNSYDKALEGVSINYEKKDGSSNISFIIDWSSLLSNKDKPVDALISLRCDISPLGECVMSVCQSVDINSIKTSVIICLNGAECKNDFFDGSKCIEEKDVFDEIKMEVRSKARNVGVSNNFPLMKIQGPFESLVNVFREVIEPKRRNQEIKIDLKKILQIGITEYGKRMEKYKDFTPCFKPERSRWLLQKLTFEDYKSMFSTLKYEMENDYDVGVEWDWKTSQLTVKRAKNIDLNYILHKLQNCFKWFSECQLISRQQYKIKPHYIGDYTKFLDKEVLLQIQARINQIVDSKIDSYEIKGWVNGCGIKTKCIRTARMIAVCWVLVNMFHCVVKGGFVRDWVVNGQQYIPPMLNDRVNMLKKNSRNQFLEVEDEKVTPSDIDVEMSSTHVFDEVKFAKEMKKLGIEIKIEEGGWRKHILFDDKTQSGGFTADLIEPYTSMTHYTYDFDVNVMYLKKDNLNSIGMKIPLTYEDENQHDRQRHKRTVCLGELMKLCRNKQMQALKQFIPDYRFTKFGTKRGWTIIKDKLYQPICYKSMFTQSFPIPVSKINQVSPQFYQKMVVGMNVKVQRIQHIKNQGWDDAFELCQHWILNQRQRKAKAQNPANYNPKNINTNNKMLFHGTRTVEGAEGIMQYGFDSRFYATGCMYGRGAYFADNPVKSDGYTSSPNHYMFVCNVALGEQEVLTQSNNGKLGPAKGYHSIYGKANQGGMYEYIIDRYGQAKPVYLITYTK